MLSQLDLRKSSTAIGIASALLLGATSVEAEGPYGFLKIGNYALNPDNSNEIVLYVPALTLVYAPSNETIEKPKTYDRRQKSKYRMVTTQDGIRLWVLDVDINVDPSVRARYDFFVNRRIPLCKDRDACREIWRRFNRARDEGDGWNALWARTAGRFKSTTGDVHEVEIDHNRTWDSGFLPRFRNGLTIEDAGFITVLDRAHPVYRFTTQELAALSTECSETRVSRNREQVLSTVHTHLKGSVEASIDIPVPTALARSVLKALGLDGKISAEAMAEWDRVSETETTTDETVQYGATDQAWKVATVTIERRSRSEVGADADYVPFGGLLVKKVFECSGGTPKDLETALFLLSFSPAADDACSTEEGISLWFDDKIVANTLGLSKDPALTGLVSIGTQHEHFKLLDYITDQCVAKSVASYIVAEINRSKPRRY